MRKKSIAKVAVPILFVSVSVISPSDRSGTADALSTALFCMTLEEGRTLIESLDGFEAFWIFPDGSTEETEGFGGAK